MAADVAGLLEAIEVPSAHIVGASMGGMVAQLVAIGHPERTRTLTSIMSTTGERYPGKVKAMRALFAKAKPGRDGAIERSENIFSALRGSRWPFDRERTRELAGQAYDRCFSPDGFQRQMAAILAAPKRNKGLRGVKAPTLVLHGTEDPLVPYAAGEAVAREVPGAKLEPIEGMGHELPKESWPIIADAVALHAGVAAVKRA
jgi:pimeloyl-ACP methyl ester carboxylesterase